MAVFIFPLTAPSQKPRFDKFVAKSTSLHLEFHSPPNESHNGPLLGYTFTAEEVDSRLVVHNKSVADPTLTVSLFY